ncbi:hypothetical protein FA15DRAFT_665038 [Coprinopsis marcescibilis]|uniref:Uncharacterized protein n=1 Tax=Coprinopsis marcescibilis TaxID=230819 RepID=A0A5C3L6D7_COPMA|nr:hypothetical protein FA15DRAFT_665038 [Coprinopsis marcescibilis]
MSTPTTETELAIPFPSVQEPSESDTNSPVNVTGSHHSVSGSDSQGTSSRLTSSDKLTALRSDPDAGTTSLNATPRPSTPNRIGAAQRGYRHSLDASVSLPSFSVSDFRRPAVESDAWLRSHQAQRSRYVRGAAASNNSSPGPRRSSPRQRQHLSSDSDGSHPSVPRHGGIHAFSRLSGSRVTNSEPSMSSPALKSQPLRATSPNPDSLVANKELPPQPRSRAVSPLRLFHQWSSGHRNHTHTNNRRHEEPFVPINPFKRRKNAQFSLNQLFTGVTRRPTQSTLDQEASLGSSFSGPYDCEDIILPPVLSVKNFLRDVHFAVTDSLPRHVYLNLLLRLPAMYFTRVSRIFEDAEVSKQDIERMIEASCPRSVNDVGRGGDERTTVQDGDRDRERKRGGPTQNAYRDSPAISSPPRFDGRLRNERSPSLANHDHDHDLPLPFPDEWTPTSVPPSLYRFKNSWETFIDSLLREWKTFNIISALLSSAIVSMFQVPEAADDPVTRTAALLSLICGLMSLSYGCMYIVRFGTMRSMSRASNWAEDAQKTKTLIWWNVWVLLAMPAIWMAWAMLLFLVAILSFVWRTGSDADPPPGERPPLSAKYALGPRIAITSVFTLGMVYLFLIISTLKRYGTSRGKAAEAMLRAGSPEVVKTVTAGAVGDVGGSLAAVAVPAGLVEDGQGLLADSSGGPVQRGRERYRNPLLENVLHKSSSNRREDGFSGPPVLLDMKPLDKVVSSRSA